MKHASLVRAVEKAGFKVQKDEDYDSPFRRRYKVENGDNYITWFEDNEKVDSIYLQRKSQPDDIMRDFFAGIFAKKIKSAIRHLQNYE